MIRQETAERIWDLTVREGGGTFVATDGSTYEAEAGYAVGTPGGLVVQLSDADVGIQGIIAIAKSNIWFGTWLDGGKVYIDPVYIVQDLDKAEELGRGFDQLAIYDFATKSVRVL